MELDKRKTEFDKIKVFVIDTKKLSEEIDKELKEEIKESADSEFTPKLSEGEFFKVHEFALLKSASGKIFQTNKECVHSECEEGKVEIDIYSEIRDNEGKIISFSFFPRFLSTAQAEELIKDHGIETNMLDFMGDLAYNSRIENNMRILLESLKG